LTQYVTAKDVLVVKDKIKSAKNYLTPNELWKTLKGRFKTKAELGTILEYLRNENMIVFDEGQIVWISNPRASNRIWFNRSLLIL